MSQKVSHNIAEAMQCKLSPLCGRLAACADRRKNPLSPHTPTQHQALQSCKSFHIVNRALLSRIQYELSSQLAGPQLDTLACVAASHLTPTQPNCYLSQSSISRTNCYPTSQPLPHIVDQRPTHGTAYRETQALPNSRILVSL